jgi:hypothetical protein
VTGGEEQPQAGRELDDHRHDAIVAALAEVRGTGPSRWAEQLREFGPLVPHGHRVTTSQLNAVADRILCDLMPVRAHPSNRNKNYSLGDLSGLAYLAAT